MLKQNWATFLKARLNCSLPGEFPFYFDQIRTSSCNFHAEYVYLKVYIFAESVYRVNSDRDGDTLFYGTFTTSLNGFFGSAVCAFSLREIDRVFDQGLFKEQQSSASAWLPVIPSQIPSPRPGQCVTDTKTISDSALHFIKSHPLMDDAVSSIGARPFFYKRDLILTNLVVDTLTLPSRDQRVIFAASGTFHSFH